MKAPTTVGEPGVVTHDYAGGHNGYYTNMTIGVEGYNVAADPDTAARFDDFAPSDNFVANINNLDFARGTNTAGPPSPSRPGFMATIKLSMPPS